MSKLVISYVLSTLAGVADVSPNDVETSLLNGTITLRNVSLRPTFVPGVLFDSAKVEALEVRLPILTSDAPIVARATGTTLVFPLDLSSPPADRAFTDIQAAITDLTILGYYGNDGEDDVEVGAVSPAAGAVSSDANRDADDAVADGSAVGTPSSEALATSFVSQSASIGDDEDDLLSCNSAGDRTDAESATSESDAEEEEPPQGFFARWRAKAVRGFGRRWRHATRIELEHAKIVLPCDTRTGMSYEAHVDSFIVTIEPQEMMENEQLSVHRMELRGIRVLAHVDDSNAPRVVDVDGLDVTITSVYHPKSGRLLRKNTVVAFTGTCAVVADEDTLFALIKCQMTRDIMMRLPDYCRPFASMRRDRSLWRYVGCCLIKQIQDRRHRYNYTLSHLRFYADSRRRYMDLLDACHRAHSVEARRQELAEAEQDLRYVDVIQFLRQRVRDKYGCPPPPAASPSSRHPPSGPSPTTAGSPAFSSKPPITSVHVGLPVVRVQFPDRQAVSVTGLSLIVRDAEQLAEVGNVTLENGDRPQSVLQKKAVPATTETDDSIETASPAPLVSVTRRVGDGFANTKVVLAESSVFFQMRHIIAVAKPLLDTFIQIGLRERLPAASTPADGGLGGFASSPDATGATTSVTTTTIPSTPVTETYIVVAPRFVCRLDDLALLVDHCAITVVVPPVGPPKCGCTLRELSVQTLTDKTYILAPVVVTMLATGGIAISDVDVRVSRSVWVYAHDALRQLPDIPVALSTPPAAPSPPGAAGVTASVAAAPTGDDLSAVKAAQRWSVVSAHPLGTLGRVSIAIEPLATTVTITRCQAFKVQKDRSSLADSCVNLSIGDVTVTCRDAASSLCLTTQLEDGLSIYVLSNARTLICIPAIFVGYTLPVRGSGVMDGATCQETARSLLSVSSVCVCKVGPTVAVDVDKVVLAEAAAEIGPMRMLMMTDPNAVPTSSGPYRSSFVQCDARLRRVSLPPLQRLDVRLLATVGGAVAAFILDEVMPTSVYQSFFSAFSDMAVQLVAEECPVVLVDGDEGSEVVRLSVLPQCSSTGKHAPASGEAPTAQIQLSSSASFAVPVRKGRDEGTPQAAPVTPPPVSLATTARRTDLGDFGPACLFESLPGADRRPPIVLRVDTRRRALILDVESLQVSLSHTSPFGTTTLQACAHQLAMETPLATMGFWSEDVRAKAPADLSLSAAYLCASALCGGVTLLDCALRDVDLYTGPRTVVSRFGAVMASACATPMGALRRAGSASMSPSASRSGSWFPADPRSPSVQSETEVSSSFAATSTIATSAPAACVGAHLGSWAVTAELSASQQVYACAMRCAESLLVDVPRAIAHELAASRCVVSASCEGQMFDLDRLGCVLFDNQVDLLSIRNCRFASRRSTTHCDSPRLVMARGSSVLFEHCIFPCRGSDIEQFFSHAGGPGACAYVLGEGCQFAPEQSDGAAPSTAEAACDDVTTPAPVRRRLRLFLNVEGGGVAAGLPGSRVLDVTQQQPLRAQYSGGSAPTSAWSASVRPLQCAVVYRASDSKSAGVVAVCPNASLEVDARATARRRSLALTASLTIEEICVPLDGAVPEAVRCLLAAAAVVRQERRARCRRDRVIDPVSTGEVNARATQTRAPLVWDQWKVLLSVSLIPVRVCLPNPNITVAKLTLSNAFLWSVREPGHVNAAVEGRFALTDVLLRDLEASQLVPVLQTSTFVDVQGGFTVPQWPPLRAAPLTPSSSLRDPPPSAHKVSLAVRLPHTELVLNTDQVRLLTTLLQQGVGAACGQTSALFPPPGVVVQTHLGVSSIRLQTTSGEVVHLDASSCPVSSPFSHAGDASAVVMLSPQQCVDARTGIVEIDHVPVARTRPLELSPETTLGLANMASVVPRSGGDSLVQALAMVPVAHRRHYGIVLSDGRRVLCSATLLTNGTLWLTLRSPVVVRNGTAASAVCFRSDFSAPWLLEAGLTGSLPLRVVDTIGPLSVSLAEAAPDTTSTTTTSPTPPGSFAQAAIASLQEVLWDGAPPSAMVSKWLATNSRRGGCAVASEEKQFVLLADGSSQFLRFTTTRVSMDAVWGDILEVAVYPSAPTLRNDTRLPLAVELVFQPGVGASRGGALASLPTRRFTVAPSETLELTCVGLSTEQLAASCRYQLLLEVYPGMWASSSSFSGASAGSEQDADVSSSTWLQPRPHVRFNLPSTAAGEGAAVTAGFFCATLAYDHDDKNAVVLSDAGLTRVCNMSDVPLTLVSDTSRQVLWPARLSSLGAKSVATAPPMQHASYVPKCEPLYLSRPGCATLSESFELDEPGSGSSRSGAFVSCGRDGYGAAESGGDVPGAQRCFLIRAGQNDSVDFVIQAPTWLVNQTDFPMQFVWKTARADAQDATVGVHVQVPPGGRVPFSWLPASGYQSHFRFQPSVSCASGMSSPRIPGEWNPGTRQTFLVQCGSRRVCFPVHVRKERFCDAAIIAVGSPSLAPLKVVNCTRAAFKEVPAMETRLLNRTVRAGDALQLTGSSVGEMPLRIDLSAPQGRVEQNGDGSLHWTRMTDRQGHVTVFILPSGVSCHTLTPPVADSAAGQSAWPWYNADLSVAVQRVTLALTHRHLVTIQTGMDSARVWIDLTTAATGPMATVQCTVEGVQVLSVAQSADPAATTNTILAPVGLNLSARDVIYLPSRHRLDMTSLQVQIRPVVLTVTDVFLYTVERVMAAGTACPQGASRCKATSGTSQTAESSVLALDMETELQQSVESALTVSTAPLSVLLHTASVSEVRLEVSYDRSVDPPADYSLPRRVPMLALLPSLYHARIVLGNRTFKNVGGASVAKTMAPVVESYLDELLSQLPSTIRSVGLFRGASVLQSAASKIASLFSGSGTTGIPRLLPPDGSALL